MPRRKTAVKTKTSRNDLRIVTPGAVDIHFHGAFGIDLMNAKASELSRLAELLWKNGVAAFCPTTLSVTAPELEQSVVRLGQWMRSLPRDYAKSGDGAIPLGLHLEGPFISPEARGAHPPGAVRALAFSELERLWEASLGTIKILTVASETLSDQDLRRLCDWSKKRKIALSLGHSRATEAQARKAFDQGFRGVTHAWNALAFHHRAPGVLGAAIGRNDVYLELIPDQMHVHPTVMRWTETLHPKICWVSDCVPAAGTDGDWQSFGPLQIRLKEGAARLSDGSLAGGGALLPESLGRWLAHEAQARSTPAARLLKKALPGLSTVPLRALGFSPVLLSARKVRWEMTPEGYFRPFPNKSR